MHLVRWSWALPVLLVGRAVAGPPAPEARRQIVDRHGHVLAHIPPLERDAACAPELYGLAMRTGAGGAEGGPIRARLDGRLQVLARLAVQRAVEQLAREGAARTPQKETPPTVGEVRTAVVRTVGADQVELDLGVAGWVGTLSRPRPACEGHALEQGQGPPRLGAGDRVRVRIVELAPAAVPGGPRRARALLQPQAALVALDPASRDVLALVGGCGLQAGDFDRATQGRRQAGSTWKPFVYAAALQSGRFHADDVVHDLPRLYGDWQPRNHSSTYRGALRLRQALAHSVNTVAVRLLADVGPAAVAALAERLGIPRAQVPLDLTQALGTALVSPLQLAGAYATLADTLAGRYVPPVLWQGEGVSGEPVLPPALCYLMTHLLGSVITEGSAVRARELGWPGLAGKTGTTTQGLDAWFVGYHSQLLAVVWVGDDAPDPAAASPRSGADTALPLWMDFMRSAHRSGPPPPFPRPPGLIEVAVPGEGGGLRELRLADTP
ncbi:MAG: penicillin-binding transpeptidase domain-containing protein [Myxococcales bacterium]|nr:penicillin-binding transpeptidase domain-containing protein [Myxococcota bacterium]MDW8284354.1 penicillin-binding transpeptidase domain-containing protein [Myxococcales bacterium]